ncbi:prpF family protein [Acinetobacter sp. 1578804]|nr:prpF family protein [Acinetobacter sp. 1578804]
MSSVPQIKIPATYMRGGTSKGVFFKLDDLPEKAQVAGQARDQLLLRVIGSPDPYGKQIDGMVVPLRVPAKLLFSLKALSQIMTLIICLVRFQLIRLL